MEITTTPPQLGTVCPLPLGPADRVLLGHGSGGELAARLLEDVFLPAFANPHLAALQDSAVLDVGGARLAFTTDSFVVTPLFFPGGDIGALAVNGTVNDLAMMGARPLYLSAGFIIEEGFPLADLRRIVDSMASACRRADVLLVTGDTKVVNRGSADRIFINTSGVGLIEAGRPLSAQAVAGDRIIVSGTLADHGMAIMAAREGFAFETPIESDTCSLAALVHTMLSMSPHVRCLRDPTRGGLATSLNELARRLGVGIRIDERRIPIRENVRAACEILGLDPLYVANEGKLVAIVSADDAPLVLAAMRQHPDGAEAADIGEVTTKYPQRVILETAIGGTRFVEPLLGELLPRIC